MAGRNRLGSGMRARAWHVRGGFLFDHHHNVQVGRYCDKPKAPKLDPDLARVDRLLADIRKRHGLRV